MAQEIDTSCAVCPLCGDELNLAVPDWRVSPKWRDVLVSRSLWPEIAAEFYNRKSIEAVARHLAITSEQAHRVLDFLCTEVCGCRAATCVSCLDDYRSEL